LPMPLIKDQRNAIFRAIAAGKLDPAECEMGEAPRLVIRHSATKSAFKVGASLLSIKIGDRPTTMIRYHSFSDILERIQPWAEDVVEWRDTPDLWALRHNWKFLTDQNEGSPNALFTPDEQNAISSQLSAIKESVKKTYALTAEQESRIDAHFDEAEKAARRLGRKDWILLFAGGIFSLILTNVITPDIAQHILMMATHGLEHLFASAPRSIRAE
jgi:hypothetical protein